MFNIFDALFRFVIMPMILLGALVVLTGIFIDIFSDRPLSYNIDEILGPSKDEEDDD